MGGRGRGHSNHFAQGRGGQTLRVAQGPDPRQRRHRCSLHRRSSSAGWRWADAVQGRDCGRSPPTTTPGRPADEAFQATYSGWSCDTGSTSSATSPSTRWGRCFRCLLFWPSCPFCGSCFARVTLPKRLAENPTRPSPASRRPWTPSSRRTAQSKPCWPCARPSPCAGPGQKRGDLLVVLQPGDHPYRCGARPARPAVRPHPRPARRVLSPSSARATSSAG